MSKGRTSLVKLFPAAVQIDQLGHLEVICLKLAFSRGTSTKYLRMQTKYYDFLQNSYKGLSFWACLDNLSKPIIVKNSFGVGLRNKIQALIMPVQGNWPDPQIDVSQIDTEEENEDVQEEEEKK